MAFFGVMANALRCIGWHVKRQHIVKVGFLVLAVRDRFGRYGSVLCVAFMNDCHSRRIQGDGTAFEKKTCDTSGVEINNLCIPSPE